MTAPVSDCTLFCAKPSSFYKGVYKGQKIQKVCKYVYKTHKFEIKRFLQNPELKVVNFVYNLMNKNQELQKKG